MGGRESVVAKAQSQSRTPVWTWLGPSSLMPWVTPRNLPSPHPWPLLSHEDSTGSRGLSPEHTLGFNEGSVCPELSGAGPLGARAHLAGASLARGGEGMRGKCALLCPALGSLDMGTRDTGTKRPGQRVGWGLKVIRSVLCWCFLSISGCLGDRVLDTCHLDIQPATSLVFCPDATKI